MFGFSFWEIAIVLGVALLLLGPKKLPELARSLGKGIREFRSATDTFKDTVEQEMNRPPDPPKAISAPDDLQTEQASLPAAEEVEPVAESQPTES